MEIEPLHRIALGLASLPARLVPYEIRKPILAGLFSEALRVSLQRGDLEFLEGKAVRIRVSDLSIHWLLSVRENRIHLLDRDRPDQVCISGDSAALLLLATRQADSDTLFFQRRIRIEGDTELGLAVKNTFDAIDWSDLPHVLATLLEWAGRWMAAARSAEASHRKSLPLPGTACSAPPNDSTRPEAGAC